MSTGLQDRIRWFMQPAALRAPMVSIIDRIGELPGHWQILSVGLTFHVLCRGAGINPHDVLNRLENMERDVDAPFASQFRAMKEYAKGELND